MTLHMVRITVRACAPRHLFGALPLHLGGARRLGPEHAGRDADGQVESVHLVVLGVALDTVQHGDDVTQQQEVFTGQEAEQPEGRHHHHRHAPTCLWWRGSSRDNETPGRAPTSARIASSPLLRRFPWHPSTDRTDPHTAGCQGCSAGSPGWIIDVDDKRCAILAVLSLSILWCMCVCVLPSGPQR